MKNNYNSSLTRQFSGWKTLFAIFVMLITVTVGNAQVTTNGGSGLNPTYPDLATAITALNSAVISSPVAITLTGNETAPVGGYTITAQGSAVNTILILGNASVITASNALVAGSLTDAIFKLIGADYITLQNFTMRENVANTTTAAATNNMTEWGVALLYVNTTDGAQNNTIQNNNIVLNRTYQNTFGIYSNSTHSAVLVTTIASATTATGGNSGLKIYSNTISNVNQGITVVGPLAAADHNQVLEIGGSALLANTISDYGTTGTFSAYTNVSGTVNGILVRNTVNYTISNNSVTSSNGGTIAGTLRGVYIPAFSSVPTGTITNNINNNTISVKSGVLAGVLQGIIVEATTVNTTTTLNINSNNFNDTTHTIAGATGGITFISNAGTVGALNVNNNTFTNLSVNTTGSVTFIGHPYSMLTATSQTFSGNAIVGTFAKTGAGGAVTFTTSNSVSTAGSISTYTNNNFSNVTLTGATALTVFNNTDGGTGSTKVITGNTIGNITGGTSAIIGMNFAYWSGACSLSNNTISNVNGQGAITGINIGATANNATSINVSSNAITELSSTGTGGAVSGIVCSNTSLGINVVGNAINTLSSTGASAVNGITISGANAAGTNVLKNKIYNLSGSNASSTVNGLNITAGTLVTAYNNIIGDLRTPNANAANPLNGINITGGTTVNAYNNTVMIAGVSSGALFGSSAISVSTTPTITLRNNIFVNNSTPVGATGFATAYRRSTTTLTTYGALSNNNLLYAGTPGVNNLIHYDGLNSYQTVTAYKTAVASRDSSSASENPNFVSTVGANATFLHIDTVIPTQIESGGVTIATVTDDFDGDIRNVSTPDIGADEFTGVSFDIIAPAISYTPLAFTCDGSVNRILTTSITDASGLPTSGAGLPVLYWRINAGAWSSATGTYVGGSAYTFSFGAGAVLNDVVSYYIVAQDNVGTPNIGTFPSAGASGFTVNPPAAATAPTTPSSYTINNALTGVYTVGVTGAYPTLTAAVAAYNVSCLLGSVTFSLIDTTYPSEAFPITINQNVDASLTNTLTIKPAIGVSPTISGSNASSIFLLNGADYVIIDGSNGTTTNMICPLSTASRDLTVTNTNTGTSSAIIWLATNVANGATNNNVMNTNLVGNSNTTTLVALGSGSSTISMSSLGTSNNNNGFVNNAISKTQFGIYSQGASVANKNTGTVINQNVINTIAPDNIAKIGVLVGFENNISIVANVISEITQTTSPDVFGISLGVQGISTTTFTGNEVTNATVIKNTVGNIRNTGTFSAVGICVAPATSGTNTITNNMISGVSANGTGGDFSGGIFVGGGAGSTTQIYHNTVTMVGTQTGGNDKSYALAIAGSDPIVDIRNNILINTQTNGTGNNYAVAYGYSTFVNLTSSYNDYVVTNPGATFFIGATGSISAPTNQLDIVALQTATGKDSNAQNIMPVFTSATNLHIIDGALDNLGTPIATVTSDFDCETRSATTPDMGADEFAFLSVNHFDTASGFNAYPNPVSNILNIEYTSDLTNVSVYNMLGQQVLSKKVTATSTQIDMSGLNAGTYLVKVEAGTVSKTLKVFKK